MGCMPASKAVMRVPPVIVNGALTPRSGCPAGGLPVRTKSLVGPVVSGNRNVHGAFTRTVYEPSAMFGKL